MWPSLQCHIIVASSWLVITDASASCNVSPKSMYRLAMIFLHFLHHCGSSSSSSLCHFTPLVLLLLPSRVLVLRLWFFLLVAPNPLLLALSYLFFVHCVATLSLLSLLLFWMNDCIVLNVVDIGLMLLFEAMSQTKMIFFWKTPYWSSIHMIHTNWQSVWSAICTTIWVFFFCFFVE